MNRAGLRRLGYELGAHLGGASEGAWAAATPDGTPVVLKWLPDSGMLDRYAVLIPALEALRARGVPVPEFIRVIPFDGGTLSVQRVLPGRAEDNPPQAVVDRMVTHIAAQAGVAAPPPDADPPIWGAFVVQGLRGGGPAGVRAHDAMRCGGPRSARLVARIEALGDAADPDWFPDTGLVHLDLHTDNVLVAGDAVSGIIDWEGACAGDHRYDLVQYAFDLDGHDQPSWDIVDATDIVPRVLRAYLARLVLKCTSAAIRFRPDDVPRQLARAERVFDRYKV